MIDSHVHMRDWKEKEKETILHAMISGSFVGIDSFFDMPNTNPPLIEESLIYKRIEDGIKAEKEAERMGIKARYHLYLGLTEDEETIRRAVSLHASLFPRVVGLKLFCSHSTGNMGIIGEEAQKRIWSLLSRFNYRGVVAVHAEKTSLFTDSPFHHISRPSSSEIESVRDQIKFATVASFKGTLHIAHISTKGAIDLVSRAKKEGKIRITSGATPHHALLDYSSESQILKMNPPLRSIEDRNEVFSALMDGRIDWIESDHAPHTLQDKMDGKCGIPGFEGTLLLINELRKRGLDEASLRRLTSENVLEAFGFREETLPPPQYTEETRNRIRDSYPFSPWAL